MLCFVNGPRFTTSCIAQITMTISGADVIIQPTTSPVTVVSILLYFGFVKLKAVAIMMN